ncbi:hypothetical protein TNCV_15051 [Trichonephila clavipes]|nr:hypothetical protein TNCV_15051 [Trichonephila clavipes]
MGQIFGTPTVPKFDSQGLNEFPTGMIGQRIRSSIRFRKGLNSTVRQEMSRDQRVKIIGVRRKWRQGT